MAFLDNLSEIITTKGKEAADKAKSLADIASLKTQISSCESVVNKNLKKIGQLYFEEYKDSDVVCEFEEQVQAIRDAKKAIEDLEQKIHEIKGTKVCSSCGAVILGDSAFCSKCGTKLEEDFFDDDDADDAEEDAPVVVDVEEVEATEF